MHELGVLCQAVRLVQKKAAEHGVERVSHITLEVGRESGYVPIFFEKLFPVAVEGLSMMKDTQLRIQTAPGPGLRVLDFGC